jgi:hypothetical protein
MKPPRLSGKRQARRPNSLMDMICEIFAGARKLFDPDPAGYTNADQVYYDLLKQWDDPHTADLIDIPDGMDGVRSAAAVSASSLKRAPRAYRGSTGEPMSDEETELNTESLRGDIRDRILTEFKHIPNVWPKMAESEQERADLARPGHCWRWQSRERAIGRLSGKDRCA